MHPLGCARKPGVRPSKKSYSKILQTRSISTKVHQLASWDLDTFQEQVFKPCQPACLPSRRDLLPARKKWFVHHQSEPCELQETASILSELDSRFWKAHADTLVPLEITQSSRDDASATSFEKIEAPLGVFLQYLNASRLRPPDGKTIYLAQHDIRNLPQALQSDLPTPDLVLHAGKGDLYSSSLWLGRPPTYTPLHRDPNPNLFVQLAGTKIVRLFSPDIGNAVYDFAMRSMQDSKAASLSSAFRGEEMMQGAQRATLEDLVWGSEDKHDISTIRAHCVEATLYSGEALFIPKGWWHSVKGIGMGVTASANWWFR